MIFGNLTKPANNPPQQHDEHVAIESAMSELGKQTDELLQAPIMEKSAPKPELPQRRIIPHSRGSSLDIVGHSASRMKQLQMKPVDEAQELLPQKAGFSYNEKPEDTLVAELPQSDNLVMTPVQDSSKETATEDSGILAPNENKQVFSADDEREKPEPPLPEKISYTPADTLGSASNTEENATQQPEETELITAQKSDIFDVNDYHSELPEPSKVQKSYTWLYVVVAFLLLLMCGLIFLTLTSQLPA